MMELREVFTDYPHCWFCGRMLLDNSLKKVINGNEVTFCSSQCFDWYKWYTQKREFIRNKNKRDE